MILKVQLLRAVRVKAEELRMIANLGPQEESRLRELGDERSKAHEIERRIKEVYGPMAPRFKVYWPGSAIQGAAYATMEVASFEVKDPNVPQAGLSTVDAMNEKEILLADGALLSELSRIGVFVDGKDITWRLLYDVRGN